MREKKDLLVGAMRYLDIPREALPGGFGIQISGKSSLTVRGCRRILQYGADCIRLSLGKKLALAIRGRGLICTVFEGGQATVEGLLQGLSFEEEQCDAP